VLVDGLACAASYTSSSFCTFRLLQPTCASDMNTPFPETMLYYCRNMSIGLTVIWILMLLFCWCSCSIAIRRAVHKSCYLILLLPLLCE
jgi:hypothetical protein